MTNFKSGSGNLDFGEEEGDSDTGPDVEEQSPADSEPTAGRGDEHSEADDGGNDAAGRTDDDSPTTAEPDYPYFVRRSNVTDERDVRLEAHVRPAVASQEATFRRELAAALETDDISKTDAREFALLYAFHHPEEVAELLRDEGFGVI